MKNFRDFLKEEVLPTVQVADGGLDISKPAVRAAINAAIAGVVSQPAVTPYVVFNRLSKLLAQYHIVLPKRFLEGDKGVEVFEVKQFGHKMGMTDSGEFVNEVPSTHYLFLQYGILSPMGITYAKPVVGGMFRVTARLVDKDELDKLLDMAEITMSEEAEVRQMSAKAMAPKEPMHDITSDEKKKGNKEAVGASEKKSLDEEERPNAWGQYPKEAKQIRKQLRQEKKAKAFAKAQAKAVKEDTLGEGRMPASVIRHKQKLANMTPEEKAKKFAGKSDEQLKSMARRHGYGKDSNEYSKHGEKDLNEVSLGKLVRYRRGAEQEVGDIKHFKKNPGQYPAATSDDKKRAERSEKTREAGIKLADKKMKGKAKVNASMPKTPYMEEEKGPCWKGYEMVGMKKKAGKPVPNCVPVKEGITVEPVQSSKGDKIKPSNMKDVKDSDVDKGMGYSTVPKGDNMPQASTPPVGTKFTNRRPEYEPSKANSIPQNPTAPGGALYEKAPPGAKYERMVKHIKDKFSKNGLTAKEKSIAYATAWKAKNREKGE
jgi:hypothetical protein